jgi:hypothetical protein
VVEGENSFLDLCVLRLNQIDVLCIVVEREHLYFLPRGLSEEGERGTGIEMGLMEEGDLGSCCLLPLLS